MKQVIVGMVLGGAIASAAWVVATPHGEARVVQPEADAGVISVEAEAALLGRLPSDIEYERQLAQHFTGDEKAIAAAAQAHARSLKAQAVLNRLTEEITVTEEEARALYDRIIEGEAPPRQFAIRVLTAERRSDAEATIAALQRPDGFVRDRALAAIQPLKDAAGNPLDWISEPLIPAPFRAVVLAEPGTVLPTPVRAAGRHWVIYLDAAREGPVPSYEEVHSQIVHRLTQERLARRLDELLGASG